MKIKDLKKCIALSNQQLLSLKGGDPIVYDLDRTVEVNGK